MIINLETRRASLKMTALVAAFLIFTLTGPATAAEEQQEELQYSKGVKQCMMCHKEGRDRPAHEIFFSKMGVTADPSTPFAEGNHDCEACHGPAKAHLKKQADGSRLPPPITFDARNSVAEQNAVCMNCHNDSNRFHWPGSVHNLEENSCVDCHDLHTPNDPVLAIETQPEVCYECHKEQRAQFLRQSRHPVQTPSSSMSHVGLMSCSDCHQPHGGPGPASLIRNTVNEQCYDCHAEKRGPFLWEHAPVQEDCSNCHSPHGSNYENLLVSRQPYLCQQCHLAQYHPSGVYSGTGLAPATASQQMLGKACSNCHVQVHGSNHPGGLRQTR